MLVYQYHVAGVQQQGSFGLVKITFLLILSSFMIVYAYTMTIVGNTIFAEGTEFTIFDYASTADLVLGGEGDTVEILREFSISTAKIMGIFIGSWGLFNLVMGTLPNGPANQGDNLITAGFTRLFISVILARPQYFFELFGLGEMFFS